jgi:hypothetical protein
VEEKLFIGDMPQEVAAFHRAIYSKDVNNIDLTISVIYIYMYINGTVIFSHVFVTHFIQHHQLFLSFN